MELSNIGGSIKEIVTGQVVAIVTDDNVGPLYGKVVSESIEKQGYTVVTFSVEPGEESKSGKTYLSLLEFLASVPLTRSDAIVALGGGVVGDLAGFAAATFLRGIKVIQVPTTLLAAVDSSVGGKTAINLEAGKNLAGAFHQPSLVYCDTKCLDTLPRDVFRDGMAEVIKYGVLQDEEFFNLLMNKESALGRMDEIIERCVAIKTSYVLEDEHDTGIRQLLNLGHTIGHTIEKLSGYKVSHGSAVAKGMAMIAEISESCGWCKTQVPMKIKEILTLYGFDLSIDYTGSEIYDILKTDKKRKGNSIDLVIPSEIGKCTLKRLDIMEIGEILKGI